MKWGKREGHVDVNGEEVASISDADFDVEGGEGWWTNEHHLRLGRHERNKRGDLVTIETHVIQRGRCKNQQEREQLNRVAVQTLQDLFVELTLTYYQELDE